MWHASIAVWDRGYPLPWSRCGLKTRGIVRETVLGLLAGVGTGNTRRDRSDIVLHARRRLNDRELAQIAPEWRAIPAVAMATESRGDHAFKECRMSKGPSTRQERIEIARTSARDALNKFDDPAWKFASDGLYHDEHILALVQIAVQDYRLRFPGSRAKGPWLFYDGDPTTTKIRVNRDGTPKSGRVDVYCLFCRVLLVNPAIWRHDYTYQLRKHTTPCALRSLAGLITPGAPGVYRLPEVV